MSVDKAIGINFKLIRWAIALLLGACALSAYSYYLASNHLLGHEQAQRQLYARIQYLNAKEMQNKEKRRIHKEYARTYRDLKRRGVFDSDARLHWLEEIERAAQQLAIPLTRYTIGSREPQALPVTANGAALSFYQTPIELDFSLYHEGDLVKVLNFLAASDLGLYEVEACELARAENTSDNDPALAAECRLQSYSFEFNAPDALNMPIDPTLPGGVI